MNPFSPDDAAALLQDRCRALEAQIAELEAVNRSYLDMLGFVAHELKSPLASAMMSVYTVKDGYLGAVNPAQARSLASAAISLEHLQDMIRNYLDLSRIDKGELALAQTYFPLHSRVIEPVLRDLEPALSRKQMVVENRIPGGRVVYADADLLRIIYENLLSNAIKYGEHAGTILLDCQEEATELVLNVQNTGPGIPEDEIPLLFRRFSRLKSSGATGQRGTGLGLYICREIVEKHGGRIWASSQPGAWVRFSFTLPQQAAAEV
ncbi:MAG: sensor histidine kinase [Anaerolineae bacterium]|jgi:signal transduction histidine kinase